MQTIRNQSLDYGIIIKVGKRPKTALALSAGGMFGAYQAGVWLELAKFFKPDIVVGASVGALNGWLIAGGHDPSILIDRWTNLESIKQPKWRIPKRLSEGLLEASLLETWIRQMYDTCKPACEYGVVLTELPGMTPRLFRWPDIGWEHVAGSCAVPGFLRHHQFSGRFYTDGGFIEPSPVWAALAMGADLVVSINVLRHRPLPIRAMVKLAQTYGKFTPPQLHDRTVINIDPIGRLGGAKDSMYWSRPNTERWIDAGGRNALTQKHFLVECLRRNQAVACGSVGGGHV